MVYTRSYAVTRIIAKESWNENVCGSQMWITVQGDHSGLNKMNTCCIRRHDGCIKIVCCQAYLSTFWRACLCCSCNILWITQHLWCLLQGLANNVCLLMKLVWKSVVLHSCVNLQVVQSFNTGYCQPPPPGCPRGVYTIMVKCWWASLSNHTTHNGVD